MHLPERCHLKNGVCEGGNWFQAGLPWQTCPLRRVISRIKHMNRGKFSIGSCQERCKFAAIRPDVSNVLQFSAFTDCVQARSEEHTSELQSHLNLVCRLL